MAKFRIGQRVRVNCPESWCHGMETRVEEVGCLVLSIRGGNIQIGYGVGIPSRIEPGKNCGFLEDELEPLVDDKQKSENAPRSRERNAVRGLFV